MASRHAHRGDFFLIAEEFPRRALLDLLGVDRRTLRRWRHGASRIPWAAYQLVHDRSTHGLSARDAAEGFNRRMILQLVEALQARVAHLELELARQARLVDWGCANDPYVWPGDPRAAMTAPPRS